MKLALFSISYFLHAMFMVPYIPRTTRQVIRQK
jgi:hypothetical protein